MWLRACLAFELLTPVNNFAAEVIDYAVTQLFCTYPGNDVISAGQEQGSGRKLDI